MLADGKKNFAGYSMLEAFGTVEFRGEDEDVKSAFVDEGGSLFSAQRIDEGMFVPSSPSTCPCTALCALFLTVEKQTLKIIPL